MLSNSFKENFSDLLEKIEIKLQEAVQTGGNIAPLFREMIYHHMGWEFGISQPTYKGKRIRPLMTLLVGKALGGIEERLIPVALAIELTHNVTIIHDDVMDRSPERRHRPTIWSIWGIGQAINAGDGLYALGYLSILNLLMSNHTKFNSENLYNIVNALSTAYLASAEGQILDVSFEARDSVSVEEYVKMVSNKTAALLECSAKCGALLCTNDTTLIKAYSKFGFNLGIAFQIRDDYLGIWGEENVTGKSSVMDIMERKKTLPVLWGLNNAGENIQSHIRAIYSKGELSSSDAITVRELLTQAGADIYTEGLATKYFDQAMKALESTNIENEWQNKLRWLAEFLIGRAY